MSTTTMSAKAWRVLSLLRMTAAAENYKYKNAFYTFLNSKYNSWWVKNVLIILAVRVELISTWIIQKSNWFIFFFSFFFFRSQHFDLCLGEKLGTHINAPSTYQSNVGHNHKNANQTVDEIPLKYLVNVPGKTHSPVWTWQIKQKMAKIETHGFLSIIVGSQRWCEILRTKAKSRRGWL